MSSQQYPKSSQPGGGAIPEAKPKEEDKMEEEYEEATYWRCPKCSTCNSFEVQRCQCGIRVS
jgi:hypothetical protein